jgi:hypothetical protein
MSRDLQLKKCRNIEGMIITLEFAKKENVRLQRIYLEAGETQEYNAHMDIFHRLSNDLEYYNNLYSVENAILQKMFVEDYNAMRKGGPSNE